jgi:hypothetical protein
MTSGRSFFVLAGLIALAGLVAARAPARATPLDADTCAKLQGEQERLENVGVEKDMAKGPVWAKANLAPEKLDLVRRFIEIEEQLLFRCRNKALVHLAPEAEGSSTGDQSDPDDDDKEATPKAGSASKQASGKPVAGAARKAPGKAAARRGSKLSSEPGVTAIAKRPPKAKMDDAYKAPPPDPNLNPFADQLKLPAKGTD